MSIGRIPLFSFIVLFGVLRTILTSLICFLFLSLPPPFHIILSFPSSLLLFLLPSPLFALIYSLPLSLIHQCTPSPPFSSLFPPASFTFHSFLFSLFTALPPSPFLFPLLPHPFSFPPFFYLSFLSGTIPPLCNLLQVTDIKVVTVALEGLENILKAGKATSDQGNYALIEKLFLN